MDTAPSFKFTRILVPTDFSTCAEVAVDYALELGRALHAEVRLCHCGTMPDYQVPSLVSPAMRTAATSLVNQLAQMFDAARHEMDHLVERKQGHGVVLSVAFVEGYPDEGIVKHAKEWGADLVVIGSHGRRGLSRILLGSVTERVVRHAPCPVLVVHPPHPEHGHSH